LFKVPSSIEPEDTTILSIGRTFALTVIPLMIPVAVPGMTSFQVTEELRAGDPVTVPVPITAA
jgi:hypothetical protein